MTAASCGAWISLRRGAIVAIAAHPTRVACVATLNGVWDWVGFYTASKPLYVPANNNVVLDLDVSFHDQGALIYYGSQCPGNQGQEPYVAFGGYPTQGNSQFRFGIANARPNALVNVAFVTGFGAVALTGPLSSGVYSAIAVALNLSTDAQGGAMLAAAVPTDPTLTGTHVTAQFAIQDSAANRAGISTTEGVELVIR